MPAFQSPAADPSDEPVFRPARLAQSWGLREISPAICLLIGLTVMVPVAPESRLTLFDGIAPILILYRWRAVRTLFWPTLILAIVSMTAMAFSAWMNQSDMRVLLGREYQIAALVIEMIGYWTLLEGTSRQGRTALLLGTTAGMCAHYFYPVDLRVLDEPIKFLLGIPLGVALLALVALLMPWVLGYPLFAAALLAAYAVFCFLVGSRSIGGVFFTAALLLPFAERIRMPRGYARWSPALIPLAAAAVYALTEIYTTLALHGWFGDRAAAIAQFQSSYGSILLGGRPEIIINVEGILDSPLLGVGIINYPSLYLYEMLNLHVYAEQTVLAQENVLYHSALFATAFESGLIAAAIWAYLIYIGIFSVPLLRKVEPEQRPLMAPLILISIWHILYSPPIPYNRFLLGIGLACAFYIYGEWKGTRDEEPARRRDRAY